MGRSLFVLISGTRILERIYKEIFDQVRSGDKKVLIYGAGDAGEIVLREIKNNRVLGYKPVGFLDDDEEKLGRRIHSVSVLGSKNDMARLIKQKEVSEVIIAIPDLPKDVFEDTVNICRSLDIHCKKMHDILPK